MQCIEPSYTLYAGDDGLVITCITAETGLRELAEDWHDLFQRTGCDNVFLSFDWMETWWRHWGNNQNLLVIVVRRSSGQLVAVAPLYVRRSPLRQLIPSALSFLASKHVGSDHLSVLVEEDCQKPCLQGIARFINAHRTEWGFIEFGESEAEFPMMMQLRQELVATGMTEQAAIASVCPYAVLPRSFEQYLASLSSNMRYNFRRRKRALEREGSFKFVSLQSEGDVLSRFQDLIRLHRLRFDHQNKRSSFIAPAVQRFHADVLKRFLARGWARLFFLEIAGTAVAALYGFSIGKKFLFYQSGMDPSWSRLSVGLVMMGCSIEEAIRCGHTEFDFLRGDEAYKFQWANGVRYTFTLRFFDPRIKSQLALRRVLLEEQKGRVKALFKQCLTALQSSTKA